MEVGPPRSLQAPASAPLWGDPGRAQGGYGAAEASASPSRVESTPGLQREGAGGAGPCGVAMEMGWWGSRGRSQAGGLLEGDPRFRGLQEQRQEPSVRARETWCGVAVGWRWWPPEGWEERPRGGAIGFSSKNLTWGVI